MKDSMIAFLKIVSEYRHAKYGPLFEEARRLKAGGFISGEEGNTILTKEGRDVCKAHGITLPEVHEEIREFRRKREAAISILKGDVK